MGAGEGAAGECAFAASLSGGVYASSGDDCADAWDRFEDEGLPGYVQLDEADLADVALGFSEAGADYGRDWAGDADAGPAGWAEGGFGDWGYAGVVTWAFVNPTLAHYNGGGVATFVVLGGRAFASDDCLSHLSSDQSPQRRRPVAGDPDRCGADGAPTFPLFGAHFLEFF